MEHAKGHARIGFGGVLKLLTRSLVLREAASRGTSLEDHAKDVVGSIGGSSSVNMRRSAAVGLCHLEVQPPAPGQVRLEYGQRRERGHGVRVGRVQQQPSSGIDCTAAM